jgi:branched-chain amino acid transport system ATP-binding protein
MRSLLLEIQELSVWYGEFEVLRNISLELRSGESIGLFGPNGHGKTTILKTISGLLRPKGGNIFFKGKNINGLSPRERVELGIIQVPQGHQLFPRMTVLENLMLGAYVATAWRKRKENLEKVFSIFPGLEKKKQQACSTLSGGERQMVAIGRGLMGDAQILMLDEPSTGLAPKVIEKVIEVVRKIRDLGQSLILVEQNAEYVLDLTERIYLIESGEVVAKGVGQDLLSNDRIKEVYFGRVGG